MTVNKIHTIAGIIIVLIFFGTGLFMITNFPDIYQNNEIIRYQFRANHVYILLIGLINFLAGFVRINPEKRWKKIIGFLSSAAIISAAILLITAFFIEPVKAIPVKPLTAAGIFLAFAGVILVWLKR